MPSTNDFQLVFDDLRSILAEYAPKLSVVHDRPDNYYLDTHTLGKNKKPIFFGGVRIVKGYVSYYLMPAYSPELQKGMSPALKKRMQGKACFNFSTVDDELFAELKTITKRAYAEWKKTGWVD